MGEEVKKISFGFSKLSKKTTIVPSNLSQPKKEDAKVEFIDCFEGKEVKLKNPIEVKDKPLIIPLKRESKDIAISNETLEKELTCNTNNRASNNSKPNDLESVAELSIPNNNDESLARLASQPVKPETLDEIAAREIVEDLNKKNDLEKTHVFSVPLTSSAPVGEKESSLDDYENIPISQFGMAMLRGMGWAPGKGIGKNEKLATPTMPTLRPKGMGLGADTVIKSANDNSKLANEELKMKKGSYIRIIAGIHKDCYGQIEGFDDESGRTIVKLALKNVSVSLNEFMVQLVDKNEFIKNSKVLNVGKFENYKDEEERRGNIVQPNKDRKLETKDYSEKHSSKNDSYYSLKRSSNSPIEIKSNCSTSSSSSHHKVKTNKHRNEIKSSRTTRRSRSLSSDSSGNSSSDSFKRKKSRSKRKKPSSHRYKSRSRSRSPKYDRHKKHKKRK